MASSRAKACCRRITPTTRSCTPISKAVAKGMLKVMAKMGISTLQSLQGRADFRSRRPQRRRDRSLLRRHRQPDSRASISTCWPRNRCAGTRSAIPRRPIERLPVLPNPGEFHWRAEGERHMWDPQAIADLQVAAREQQRRCVPALRRSRERRCDAQAARFAACSNSSRRQCGPIPIDEVEPAKEIVKRFCTGAMSFGSHLGRGPRNAGHRDEPHRRQEQHRRRRRRPGALQAAAQRRLASAPRSSRSHRAASASRSSTWPTPTSCRSRWRRAPSPAKAASCPATRSMTTSPASATRTPGVGLISPPPHHDIYSIEDLEQLIHDLKNSNPSARVSVKLVAEVGVGTIAAGVAKAHADHILISGDTGGTGASPLTSIKHAGLPWELGIAETHQTLVLNDLRSRVVLQTDGQLKTGRDVVIAAHARRRGIRLRHRAADHARLHHDAQVPSQHLPGRRRHAGPGAAQEVRRQAGARRSTICSWSPRKRGRSWRARLPHDRTRWSAASIASKRTTRSSTGRPTASTSRRSAHAGAEAARRRRGRIARGSRITASSSRSTHELIDAGQTAIEAARSRRDRTADPQHQPHGRHDAQPRDRQALGRRAAARRHDPLQVHRLGRPELRRVPRQGRHARAGRRRQRLRRQGPVRRPDRHLSADASRRFVAEDNIIIGNVALYGATSGEAFFRGRAGRAVLPSATAARTRSSKASATTAANT